MKRRWIAGVTVGAVLIFAGVFYRAAANNRSSIEGLSKLNPDQVESHIFAAQDGSGVATVKYIFVGSDSSQVLSEIRQELQGTPLKLQMSGENYAAFSPIDAPGLHAVFYATMNDLGTTDVIVQEYRPLSKIQVLSSKLSRKPVETVRAQTFSNGPLKPIKS